MEAADTGAILIRHHRDASMMLVTCEACGLPLPRTAPADLCRDCEPLALAGAAGVLELLGL